MRLLGALGVWGGVQDLWPPAGVCQEGPGCPTSCLCWVRRSCAPSMSSQGGAAGRWGGTGVGTSPRPLAPSPTPEGIPGAMAQLGGPSLAPAWCLLNCGMFTVALWMGLLVPEDLPSWGAHWELLWPCCLPRPLGWAGRGCRGHSHPQPCQEGASALGARASTLPTAWGPSPLPEPHPQEVAALGGKIR